MLVRERTESVGTEVDEGFHVLFCEPSGSNFALVVHCVVVVFIVCPARLADGFIGHLFSVLAIFLILRLSRFAGFGLALGHGALLAGLPGLPGAFAGSLAALHEALLVLLPQALLAWVLLLLALLLSITILVLLAILILTLALLIITLALVLLIVTLALVLLIVALVLTLLAVLLLLTVLRHSFGKLRLKDQVTSQRIS